MFAVGISSYQLDQSWRLPNAAEHALAFAAWARAQGVPRDQVHLFLSTADHARLGAALAKAEVDVRPATFSVITDFTFRDLPTKTGELLYMFWAGHGSVSEDGARVLFFEDLSMKTQLPFDLNDFFARLRTSAFERFGRQIAFVDACANRFEELEFAASLGEVRAGKGHYSHGGIKQAFFLAADSGEQAREGAFGTAVLSALAAARRESQVWPPDQDAIVATVRPQFEKPGQHPVQLVWTTAEGDEHGVERVSGELPASRSVNAAARSRRLPVRALRRLAEIALQLARLGNDSPEGGAQRDGLYESLCKASGRVPTPLPRSTPGREMLHLVGAALQWNQEGLLASEVDRLAPAAEFSVELERLALIQEVRAIVEQLPAGTRLLRDEYLKTISRYSQESTRQDATTLDAMLDELYQISASLEPERPVWEFLLRLAPHFPSQRDTIERYLVARKVSEHTLRSLRDELLREERFVLSINLCPADSETPAIGWIDAVLVKAGTSALVHSFKRQTVASWSAADACMVKIVEESRRITFRVPARSNDAR